MEEAEVEEVLRRKIKGTGRKLKGRLERILGGIGGRQGIMVKG